MTDPVANVPPPDLAPPPMPEVPKDLGNKLWAKVGEGIDNMMNMIIESAGNLVGAVVTKGPGMLMDAAASVTSAATNAASAPFKNISAAPSPGGETVRAPDGPSKARTPEVAPPSPSMEASLGDLQPASTPKVGMAQSQGQSWTR